MPMKIPGPYHIELCGMFRCTSCSKGEFSENLAHVQMYSLCLLKIVGLENFEHTSSCDNFPKL
jgi:hypothetical protein